MLLNGNRIEIEVRFNFSHLFIKLRSYIKLISMSNDHLVLFQIVISHCGIDSWGKSVETEGCG